MIHFLKIWPQYFESVRDGSKTFEIRKNDRGFKVGDTVVLREWSPGSGEYTGREEVRPVTYITFGPDMEIPRGYCVMALGWGSIPDDTRMLTRSEYEATTKQG